MIDNNSVEEICDRIREDGKKEAESILAKAESSAAEIVARGEKEKDDVVKEILAKAREKGEIEQKRLLSGVHIEMNRARLRVREGVISDIMDRVNKSLAGERESGDYSDTLKGLIVEGIRSLGGNSFYVAVDGRDIDLVSSKVLPSVRTELSGEIEDMGEIEVKRLDKASLGGARIGVPGGKVIFDNTFEARMYRLRDEIRNIIFEEVFQTGGSEGSGSA